LEKVDQLGTQIFLPLELNKSLKTVQFNNQLLAKENKTLLAFNEAPQALGGTTYTPIPPWFILFMNRKIIKIYFFTDGNIRIVLLFVDSTLAITSWHTITTSYYSTPYSLLLYFWFTK
jgi:hypothetical protein